MNPSHDNQAAPAALVGAECLALLSLSAEALAALPPRLKDAKDGLRKSIQPQAAVAPWHMLNGMALYYVFQGQSQRAIRCLEMSLRRQYKQLAFQRLLIQLLKSAGRWDGYAGKSPLGLDIIDAMETKAALPERYHPELVGKIFDGLATGYDARVEQEQYLEDREVARVAQRCLKKGIVVADLGCGTGRVARLLDPMHRRSQRLIGVDMSPAMLSAAAEAGLYDQLVEADIFSYLRAETENIDVLLAASVLPFFGDLQALFTLAGCSQVAGSHLVFSVDVSERDDVEMVVTGRFAHGLSYVERCLAAAGYRIESCNPFSARRERNVSVPAVVICAVKLA